MATRRSVRSGRFVTSSGSNPSTAIVTGSPVKVTFGRREVDGVVVGTTVTGRYTVSIDVPGVDDPLTATYARDEVRSSA